MHWKIVYAEGGDKPVIGDRKPCFCSWFYYLLVFWMV